MIVDVRTGLYIGVDTSVPGLEVRREGEVLVITGLAHGRPITLSLPIRTRTRTARLTTLRVECPSCARLVYRPRILPDGSVGCRQCKAMNAPGETLKPVARALRRKPTELAAALESPSLRHHALLALQAGPPHRRRVTAYSAQRPQPEPWPDALLELRWRLFGLK